MADPQRPTLLSLDTVLQRLLAVAHERLLPAVEKVDTFDSLGRVLARSVVSALDVPPADNTAMDGYALRAADVPVAGTLLPVSQRIPAGVVGQPLQPGTAVRIFTGAQVPPGADAVVMQEQCSAQAADGAGAGAGAALDPAGLGSVRIDTVPQAGQWVRRRGEDVLLGAEVLAARHPHDAAGHGPGRQRGCVAPDGAPPAAGGAVFHRRRTGDAG